MTSLTRGPLSPAVYWRRRLFVLGLAVALVMLIAGLLRGASDGSSGYDPEGLAEQAAAAPSSAGTSEEPSDEPTRKKPKGGQGTTAPASPSTTPLAAPTGPCTEDDLLVQPVVENAVAGRAVPIRLDLRTKVTAACTWRASSQHLTLKITSGSDDIWASRQCPRSVPVQDVVVRRDVTTSVTATWNARRSDVGCTRLTDWALPGYYYVAAAALGGEPADVQFRLVAPSPEVITESPDPQQGQQQGQQGQGQNRKPEQQRG